MHVRYTTALFRVWLCLLALAGFQVNAATTAQVASDVALGRFILINPGPGQQLLSYGAGGVPVTSPSPSVLSTDGGSSLVNTRTGSIPNPSGNVIDVTAKGKYSGAKLAPVLGRALKLLPVLGTGVALYDLYREVGMVPSRAPDGSMIYQKVDPTICTVAPCYSYTVTIAGATGPATSTDRATACAAAAASNAANTSYSTIAVNPRISGVQCVVDYLFRSNGAYYFTDAYNFSQVSVAPSPAVYVPSSEQEFADAIALKSGWPTSSALSQAVADAVALTGDQIAPDTLTVTGPATSTGLAKTVVNPDGSKTVSTPTYNHTYNNNTVNTITTTTINTYNSSGALQSTSTQTETPPATKTDCEIDPTMVGCAHLDTPTSDVLNKKTQAVTVTAVAFASSSVCPSPLSFNVRGSSYSVSYQPMCDRLAMLRTLFLAIAGVLAAFIVADSFRVQ